MDGSNHVYNPFLCSYLPFYTPPPTMANNNERPPEREAKRPGCCISHLFHYSALKSPDKVAVIHASGGAKLISQQPRNNYAGDWQTSPSVTVNESIESQTTQPESSSSSPQPPVYEGDQCFTYSDIHRAVDVLSSRLKRILDGGDDSQLIRPAQSEISSSTGQRIKFSGTKYIPRRIGIYMEPSVEYIVGVLSVLRCGEAFMPLDPSWPKERILSVVSSSRADLVIGCKISGDDKYFHQLDKLNWLVSSGHCPVLCISMTDFVIQHDEFCDLPWPCQPEVSRFFSYLMYTSGSTGKPKGVCGTEAGLLNRFFWMQDVYPLRGEEHLIFKTSTSFIDHVQEFLCGMLTNNTIVIPPFNELKENILLLVDFLQMYAVSRLVAVPSLMRTVLLPLQSPNYARLQSNLKVLVLSGEVFHLSLCETLMKLLPHTAVLNLYGSTEVSGDCTYFDCKQLPMILDNEVVCSVPIGLPLYNCDVVLVGEDAPRYGEICVQGLCNAAGYYDHPSITPLSYVELPEEGRTHSNFKHQYYFKTGDFARQLDSGVLIFVGREDHTIKFNGQRIALEEIERTLIEHPDIVNAAVVCQKNHGDVSYIEAHVVRKPKEDSNEHFESLIRRWMFNKLPEAVVPSRVICAKSLPLSSSGKVDYNRLLRSSFSKERSGHTTDEFQDHDLLKAITKVFCDALMVEEVSTADDFFDIGGNSLSAAYVSYSLGINMKLLYAFPTPLKLQMALQRKIELSSSNLEIGANLEVNSGATHEIYAHSMIASYHERKHQGKSFGVVDYSSTDYQAKRLKKDLNLSVFREYGSLKDNCFWDSNFLHTDSSFSRCNKSTRGKAGTDDRLSLITLSGHVQRERNFYMQQLWKVHMESCVDASPLIVCKGSEVFLFIGSHSGKFVCVDAKSGSVFWEIKLEGRTECSAAVVDNFSQVVVGCYQGNIYFLNVSDGNICWKFRTGGEVKSQPLVDEQRHLVWCGSYDQILYGLDYKDHCCTYKLSCGGSIFSAPVVDQKRKKLFVASTSGLVTAVALKTSSCSKLWIQDFEAPVFGSLLINCSNGNVICCLVNGNVVAVDTNGSIVWKASCGGPIFAGPSISNALPSQVIVCCRDGSIYSFEMEKGDLLWQHDVGSPMTSSAHVDEFLELTSDASSQPDKLVCVCTSSGVIHVLRINSDATGTRQQNTMVHEFSRLELEGDIFSSPVMIGGRVFVGCRDDYVYCFGIEPNIDRTKM
ncbi:OLC1v1001811C1 [Oldenlandia corymbosa var. corymbosa]|uniref:OLC1v1001811C1 n=1 Tax=Oldenlandia corymbosa var. corymbosa TaxID=529605 RepID=A0AAV1D8Y6_OLDCO|nr:OLC1v1001811C1 [Oldenlandia corymbosa var. corymbosa]